MFLAVFAQERQGTPKIALSKIFWYDSRRKVMSSFQSKTEHKVVAVTLRTNDLSESFPSICTKGCCLVEDCAKDGGEEFFTEMHCVL